jgi:hypothetical protein
LHGFPVGQTVIAVTATQPLLAFEQVTNVFPWQDVPGPAAHSAGGAGHEQFAVGWVPVHGFPTAHVIRPEMETQPCASATHVARVDIDSQKLPCPPVQPAGATGQAQAAFGSVPWQI